MFLPRNWIQMAVKAVLGNMDISSSQKSGLIFGGAIVIAGIVLSTVVFPFWNLIREDVYEEVVILSNVDGICYVDTSDNVPKQIENCDLVPGDPVTIKFGKDLAWATIVSP